MASDERPQYGRKRPAEGDPDGAQPLTKRFGRLQLGRWLLLREKKNKEMMVCVWFRGVGQNWPCLAAVSLQTLNRIGRIRRIPSRIVHQFNLNTTIPCS